MIAYRVRATPAPERGGIHTLRPKWRTTAFDPFRPWARCFPRCYRTAIFTRRSITRSPGYRRGLPSRKSLKDPPDLNEDTAEPAGHQQDGWFAVGVHEVPGETGAERAAGTRSDDTADPPENRLPAPRADPRAMPLQAGPSFAGSSPSPGSRQWVPLAGPARTSPPQAGASYSV